MVVRVCDGIFYSVFITQCYIDAILKINSVSFYILTGWIPRVEIYIHNHSKVIKLDLAYIQRGNVLILI